jgi:hypothetical protein
VLDQLHFLEDFFMTMHAQGTPMVQLYERVQGEVLNSLLAYISSELFESLECSSTCIKLNNADYEDVVCYIQQLAVKCCRGYTCS